MRMSRTIGNIRVILDDPAEFEAGPRGRAERRTPKVGGYFPATAASKPDFAGAGSGEERHGETKKRHPRSPGRFF